jgi:hypothetical protein
LGQPESRIFFETGLDSKIAERLSGKSGADNTCAAYLA